MEYELVLQHSGVKNMRWGIRRWQNKDGSLTPAGKARYAKMRQEKGDKSNSDSANKKGSSESESPEDYEARKMKAVKTGGVNDVLEFKNDLTQQQRTEAYNRLQWEQNMKNLAPKQVDEGKERADAFFKKVDTVAGYADTSAKAWNTFANFYNAFSGSDVSLPKIDRDLTKGNRQTRREEKKKQKQAADAKKQKEEEANQKAAGGNT